MAINNIEEKRKAMEEKRAKEEALKIHSQAIAKLYKDKKQIDNSRNTKR
jgi:hypothetical protein